LNVHEKQYPEFRWLVLAFGALAYFASQLTYLSVAPVLQPISRSLGITPGAATILLMSSFLAAGSVTWIAVGGYLSDRFGVFVALILGMVCLAVPSSLTPWLAGNPAAVFWLRVVEGFSIGLMFPTIPVIANTLFPLKQRGLSSGLSCSSLSLGCSAGVVLGPRVLLAVGGQWKVMSAVLSLFSWATLAFGVVLYLMYNRRLPIHSELAQKPARGPIRHKPHFWPLTILGIATTFLTVWALQGIYSLAPTFLAVDKPLGAGYGAVMAGQLALGATLLAGVLGPVLNGFLLDKVFHGRVRWNLCVGFALMCVCVYLLQFPFITGNPALLEANLILGGFGPMFAFPTMTYLSACFYPPRVVGKMGGLWSGIGNCGGVLCVYCAGLMIRTHNSYGPTFTLQALIAALGFTLTFILVKYHKRVYLARSSPHAGGPAPAPAIHHNKKCALGSSILGAGCPTSRL